MMNSSEGVYRDHEFLHTADHTHNIVTYLNGPVDRGFWSSFRVCAASDDRARELAKEFIGLSTCYLDYEVKRV
jgi:hypothetical protein